MKQLDQLLCLLTGMTGLTFEDLLREAEAETECERQAVQMENIGKMADFVRRADEGTKEKK